MSDSKNIISSIKPDQYGSLVVELQVMKEGVLYRMVGILMDVCDGSVRIAFSSKEEVVDDSLVVAISDIQSVRVVPDSDIETLS